MSAEKSEGLILRTTDFSESSKIAVFFTRDFGKISVLAKGGRRLKGPFESGLDLLSTCQIVFLRKQSASLDLLTEAKLVQRFQPATGEMFSLYGGYYVAELLLGLTEDYDPHPQLYDESQRVLSVLADPAHMRLAVARLELTVLREIGQLPDFDHCAGCGAMLNEGKTFGFWGSQGGLICPDCQREGHRQTVIQAGTAELLRRLAEDGNEQWLRWQLSAQQWQELKHVCTAAVCHAMGHRPKMLAYLR